MFHIEKKIKFISYVFMFLFIPGFLFAQSVSFSSISVSNANPAPGSVVGVTVVYCQLSTFKVPYFYVGLNPSQTTLQACPAVNQTLLVDKNTSPTGVSPVTSSANDANDGGGGWAGVGWNGTALCPTTQIWNVTIPSAISAGPYNLIVQEHDYYIGCDGAAYPNISTVITLPLPSAAFTIAKRAEATTAAPNGFILYSIDYSFVNTTGFNIWDTVPPNTTLVSVGPQNIASGVTNVGSPAGSPITWTPGAATTQQTGTVWFLVSVNPGTADGTIINNTASGQTNDVGLTNSNTVPVTVQIPNLNLTKSESANSLAAGSTVTYNLDWTATGKNLQLYDSYDNIVAGNSTSGSAVAWGYDGTNYTVAPAGSPSANGTWTVEADAQGNHYIRAQVAANCPGGPPNQLPELIRSVPGLDICSDFIVEGDIEIPLSTSCPSGADAHIVLACNPSQGITLKAALSIDNNPGNLFIQKNNIYPLPAGAAMAVNFPVGSPTTITFGLWYTVSAEVKCSGTGTITYIVALWPKGNPAAAVTLNYTDNTAIQPFCSGGWTQGWQVDATSGEDWYSNLKIFGPGPIVSAAVTDIVPTGVSYLGSSTGAVYNAGTSTISWNSPAAFPATMFSFDTAINWWGNVACPGPINNSFTMAASGIPVTTSNTVSLTLSSCITPTPTPTNTTGPSPTNSPTPSPTNSPTLSPTQSPTNTPTLSPTLTITNTSTLTPIPTNTNTPTITYTLTISPTSSPTPPGLHVWPIPFDPKYAFKNFFKAYMVPSKSTMDIYTVSGELTVHLSEGNKGTPGEIDWDGHNTNNVMVSTGTYYYVIQGNGSTLLKGKVLVLIDQ